MLLRHPEAAADVDDAHIGKSARELRQQEGRVLPVADIENAAARMRMQARDAGLRGARMARALLEIRHRDAKF